MSYMTKNAMADALKELLDRKSLAKITVSDITDKVGCNRMTFYYHFENIYELTKWMLKRECDEAFSYKKDIRYWDDNLLMLMHFLADNPVFISNLYHSISKEELYSYFHKLIYGPICKVLRDSDISEDVSDRNIDFITRFFTYALVGILLEWVDKNMKDDPEVLIKRIRLMVKGEAARLMETFRGM